MAAEYKAESDTKAAIAEGETAYFVDEHITTSIKDYIGTKYHDNIIVDHRINEMINGGID